MLSTEHIPGVLCAGLLVYPFRNLTLPQLELPYVGMKDCSLYWIFQWMTQMIAKTGEWQIQYAYESSSPFGELLYETIAESEAKRKVETKPKPK